MVFSFFSLCLQRGVEESQEKSRQKVQQHALQFSKLSTAPSPKKIFKVRPVNIILPYFFISIQPSFQPFTDQSLPHSLTKFWRNCGFRCSSPSLQLEFLKRLLNQFSSPLCTKKEKLFTVAPASSKEGQRKKERDFLVCDVQQKELNSILILTEVKSPCVCLATERRVMVFSSDVLPSSFFLFFSIQLSCDAEGSISEAWRREFRTRNCER